MMKVIMMVRSESPLPPENHDGDDDYRDNDNDDETDDDDEGFKTCHADSIGEG